jgi:effector-binding domain-containing protein
MFEVRQRQVPDQVVITKRSQGVTQDDLPDLNRATMKHLSQQAQAHGGGVGPIFAIFHSDEHYDPNNIDFEVCLPISPGEEPSDPRVRMEPAHDEAYVTITKAQAAPPNIGAAYQAVVEWVQGQGLDVVFAPREVYIADFDRAADDDAVFEIAYPVK